MKKLLVVGLIVLAGILGGCEFEDLHNFHLVYSITSLNENEVDITVTYKLGDEYITESIITPFVVEQDMELDKAQDENFYYYLEVTSTDKNNINIQVISNDKKIHTFNNFINPIKVSGYIGFELTSVNINL